MFHTQTRRLSPAAKRSLAKSALAGAATLAAYLLVVVVTTPSLPPAAAINAAFAINSAVIGGSAGGVGAQVFFSSYAKSLGCPLGRRGGTLLGAGSRGTTVAGSFFSFFSLVPLGCCGSWLFILSLLPSVFGGTLSAVLITYSQPLSYAGLAGVMGFAALSGVKLRSRIAHAA
ncbi:hypothetical protein [Nitrososphaera sp.]|uniref:hypothetical protein n=1 Tax=Nitrososphaera sp. TaxID=1971748 RepID=UPI00307D1B1A